jgi:hypothetical protein
MHPRVGDEAPWHMSQNYEVSALFFEASRLWRFRRPMMVADMLVQTVEKRSSSETSLGEQ